MATRKFSKDGVGRFIATRMANIQDVFTFDPNDGTHQLEVRAKGIPKMDVAPMDLETIIDMAVNYGRLEAYKEIAEEYQL